MHSKPATPNIVPDIPVEEEPPNGKYWIRILIHGSFVSAFNEKDNIKSFEIGALAYPEDVKYLDNHHLSLSIFSRKEKRLLVGYTLKNEPGIDTSKAELKLQGANGICKFQLDHGKEWDRQDFRWIFDLEALHGGSKLSKNQKYIGARFHIYNGVVHTLVRSVPLQKKRVTGDTEDYRSIAQVLAVAIGGDNVKEGVLDVDGLSLKLKKDDMYNIILRNDCGSKCSDTQPAQGARLDCSLLNKTLVLQNGEIEIMDNKKLSPDHKKQLVIKELESVDSDPAERKKKLLGLEPVFGDVMNKDKMNTRYDPCGMGFFGYSYGVD